MAAVAYILLTASSPPAAADDCTAPVVSAELTLGSALAHYEQCNATLIQARATVAAAVGDRMTASHAPNPTVSFTVSNINPGFGTGGGPLVNRTVDSALHIDQLVERGGKRAARGAASASMVTAADEVARDTELRGEQALLESYLAFAAARATATWVRESAVAYRQSLQTMSRRLQAGDVAEVDVRRTELDAARAEADAESADLAVQNARVMLSTVMGVPKMGDAVATATIEALLEAWRSTGPVAEATPAEAVMRPDVLAATARLDATHHLLDLAQATRKRDVDLTLGFDHWPASAANPQGTGNSYTVGFSIPLFLYDSGRGGVAHARADLQAASSDLRSRQATADLELQSLRSELAQDVALATRYREQLLPSAEKILAAQESAYTRGGTGLIDLLDARRNARQISIAAIDAERNAMTVAGRLEVAAGRHPVRLFMEGADARAREVVP